MFASGAISDRAREAERRGRVQKSRGWFSSDKGKEAPSGWFSGKPKRMVEKREGPLGQQRVTRQNRGWFT